MTESHQLPPFEVYMRHMMFRAVFCYNATMNIINKDVDRTNVPLTAGRSYVSILIFLFAFLIKIPQNSLLIFPLIIFFIDASLLVFVALMPFSFLFFKTTDWLGTSISMENMQISSTRMNFELPEILSIGTWSLILFSVGLALLTTFYPKIGAAITQRLLRLKFWTIFCLALAFVDVAIFAFLSWGQQETIWIVAMMGVVLFIHFVCLSFIVLYHLFSRMTSVLAKLIGLDNLSN